MFGKVTLAATVVLTSIALYRMTTMLAVKPRDALIPSPPGATGDDGSAADVVAAQGGWDWSEEQMRLEMVIWLGWMTAACTGLGVVPFLFTSKLPASIVAVCNALACGMMVAASLVLVAEGIETRDGGTGIEPCHAGNQCGGADGVLLGVRWSWWGLWRTLLGVAAGAVFVRAVEAIVPEDAHNHHRHGDEAGRSDETGGETAVIEDAAADADDDDEAATKRQRSAISGSNDPDTSEDESADRAPAAGALGQVRRSMARCLECLPAPMRSGLIFLVVMAAHSLAEGIGLGVSFGGARGHARGPVISSTLAVHNIPEGLAICLVLIPKGASLADAAAWAVWSSIPQPLFAVPALLFVDTFTALLPIGLGFASGAMLLVSAEELWPQAAEKLGTRNTAGIVVIAALAMLAFQSIVHDH